MNRKKIRVIHYVIVAMMLSTSAIYFVATYQQFTDESGNGIREIPAGKSAQEGTSDIDKGQWNELNLSSQIETMFFLIISIAYIPIGIWMLKTKSEKPHIVALIGSLSLITLYIISRTINLPIVGIQTDVGATDIIAKILQGGIVAGTSFLIIVGKKLESKQTSS